MGPFSEELNLTLLKSLKDAKAIKKKICEIEKELVAYGCSNTEFAPDIILNLDFARINMKSIIYTQAVFEGIEVFFSDIEHIIENGKVNNIYASDVQKILNLKHAWEFILDKDVIRAESNYYICQCIAKLVNEGFYYEGGRIRGGASEDWWDKLYSTSPNRGCS